MEAYAGDMQRKDMTNNKRAMKRRAITKSASGSGNLWVNRRLTIALRCRPSYERSEELVMCRVLSV